MALPEENRSTPDPMLNRGSEADGQAGAEPCPARQTAAALNTLEHSLQQLPGLDAQALLQMMRGKVAKAAQLLHMFAEKHRDDVDQLRRLLDAADRESAERVVHSLKGASGTLSLSVTHHLAVKINEALRAGADETLLHDDIAALDTALSDLCRHIDELPG